MKRLFIVLALATLATGVCLGQVAGTAHDLTASAAGGDRVCVFCHTPHNAAPDVPLWNHTLSGSTFTAYDSITMDATDNGNWTGADGTVSALCMSCHDGSVGLGSLINTPAAGGPTDTTTTMGAVAANLGTDLTNDHPVAFTYDGTLQTADGELVDPATLTGAVGLFGTGQVECASCHDAHDDTNAPFLVMDNTGSALCVTCHVK